MVRQAPRPEKPVQVRVPGSAPVRLLVRRVQCLALPKAWVRRRLPAQQELPGREREPVPQARLELRVQGLPSVRRAREQLTGWLVPVVLALVARWE